MIFLFASKVWRQVLLEARFVTASALVVLLFGLGSLIAAGRHGHIVDAYGRDLARAQTESNLDHLLLVKKPHPLGFLSSGSWWTLPRLFYAGPRGVEEVAPEEFKGSFLAGFAELDWVYVIAVILSLLAIFVSHDLVAGEREDGTLRLILAQPVRRSAYLIGSSLGLLAILLMPLLLGVLVGLVVLQLAPGYELGPWEIGGVVAVTILAAFYLALFVAAGVLVSSLCRHASTALIWLVLFWVVFVVILPPNGAVLASLLEAPPQYRDETAKVEQLERNYEVPIEDYYPLLREVVEAGGGDAAIQTKIDRLRDRILAEQVRRVEERDRLIVAVHEEFARRRARHLALSRLTTMASPAVLFRDAVERLVTSGLHDHRNFLRLAQSYQQSLREPFAAARRRHAAEGRPRLYWMTEYGGFSMTGAADYSYEAVRPDPDLFPPFAYRRPPLRHALVSAAWEGMAILGAAALLFLAALGAFARYDVR